MKRETYNIHMEFEHDSCQTCGVHYMFPVEFVAARRKDKRTFYCPNGHQWVFNTSQEDLLREERNRLKQNEAYLESRITALSDERDAALRRTAAAKGQITKLKNRAANGVCPCCNRTFSDLARHMHSKHPGFVAEPDATEHVH